MDISELEARFRIQFPARHRQVLQDPTDPIHDWCVFLVPTTPYVLHDFTRCNEILHNEDPSNPWPEFLVAFASGGCGDYWAYDTRQEPPTIIYIDPDRTVTENLTSTTQHGFDCFDAWYADYAHRKKQHFDSARWWKDRNA